MRSPKSLHDSALFRLKPGPLTTLGSLPLSQFSVTPQTDVQFVAQKFEAETQLPGVCIPLEDGKVGVLSRDRLMELLSRPFGLELFMRRPIQIAMDAVGADGLVLDASTSLNDAVQLAMQRPPSDLYEPLTVRIPGNEYRLLDFRTLLLAQSRLLELANEEVLAQKLLAERANQTKSEFLANMSHEIRTPLTAILGFAENQLDPQYSEEEKLAGIHTILRSGEHLLTLINDILDLSKIEAGRFQLDRLEFSPAELVADVVSAVKVRADAKQLPLRLVFGGPLPQRVTSDPHRLRQILINLVGNAVKFTSHGKVELRVECQPRLGPESTVEMPDENYELQFQITDTGIGMTTEQQQHAFQAFQQADGSTARRYGGTGLGLSISRQLTQLLGGSISLESRAGTGSRFSVHIPVSAAEGFSWMDDPAAWVGSRHPQSTSKEISLTGRILLAEDGPDNQILITSFLTKAGAEVTIAENGAQAVELALASAAEGAIFDAILMDMQMPVMDGLTAVAKLREADWPSPIIALTANAMEGDRAKCLAAGCSDYATKPIQRDALLRTLSAAISHFHQRKPQRPGQASSQLPVHVGMAGKGSHAEMAIIHDAPSHIFNAETALKRMAGDHDLLLELAKMMVDLSPRWIQDLDDALSAKDGTVVRRTAHSLKNSADNMGGQAAVRAARRIEEFARDGQLDEAASAFTKCREQFELLVDELVVYLQSREQELAPDAAPSTVPANAKPTA